MSRPPRFDDAALVSVLGDRARHVRQIGEVAKALLDGRLPSRSAALFVGGALLSWLENGGDLCREYLNVVKPKSHRTPAAIWQEINLHQDEEVDLGSTDKLETSTSKSERRK